jgi:single-strand DNA-binding protein
MTGGLHLRGRRVTDQRLRALLRSGRKPIKPEDDDGPTADFFDVTVWGAEAENCAKYLRKGRLAAVSARLEPTAWEAADGSKRRGMEIIATGIEFLDRAPRDPNSQERRPQEVPAAA